MGPLEALAETDVDATIIQGQPNGYLGAFGSESDAELVLRRETTRHRFPPSAHYRTHAGNIGCIPASNDSPVGQSERLRLIGRTRDIERYPDETDAQYCERLALAFPTHSKAGTPNAIIEQLNAIGLPQVRVLEEYEYGITHASEYGCKFVVLIGPNYGTLGWKANKLGQWALGQNMLGITGASQQQVRTVARVALKWKQVFSFPLRVVFLFDDAVPLGFAKLGTIKLGQGGAARLLMGDRRPLGIIKLGSIKQTGFGV
jgi:hypothetical protein